jgi:hypothetical protein
VITETPPLREALALLRDQQGSAKVDFDELVLLGAREKTKRLRRSRPDAQAARDWLAERVLAGDLGLDVDAANDVKQRSLV